MSHVITFYTDDYDDVVVKLINDGFAPLMATARKCPEYFRTFEGVFKFWSFWRKDWTENVNEVDVSIGVPEGCITNWDRVAKWFRGEDIELALIKPVKCMSDQRNYLEKEIHDTNMDKYFYEEVVDGNRFYAEIRKPLTDQPYTIVVEDWTREKMIYMFSSICSVPSFGVLYPHDRNFIVSLWKWKGMPGEFSLTDLASKHVKAVEDEVTHEPIVYRKSMGEVIDMFNEGGMHLGHKRRRNEVPPK